ncbi:hypothetical protein DFH07DRAFT_731635 [Mycena maculata]|uniref:Aminoglycoside phosphotransferase domain-containing protein n=1 Tax=Mycena maculata TaxID=230809 RepID=A0AAD7K4V1_9AGAR|nr:hypothetical protein DFH07DRAFT_731635 [Mycena maculata]
MVSFQPYGLGRSVLTRVSSQLFILRLNAPEGSSLPKKVLARVARDLKSRSDISLESEVATMVYVRQNSSVPVPTVYGYCPTRNNLIGQPFSIISFSEGLDMDGVPWENLPLHVKLVGVRDFADIVSQLSQLQFKAIGSIYFKFGDPHKQIPVGFVLGPVSWCKHESTARADAFKRDRGPWKTTAHWLRAAVEDESQFVEKLPSLARETSMRKTDREKCLRLAQKILPKFRDRIPDTNDPWDQCAAGPFVLGHMDLNPRYFPAFFVMCD